MTKAVLSTLAAVDVVLAILCLKLRLLGAAVLLGFAALWLLRFSSPRPAAGRDAGYAVLLNLLLAAGLVWLRPSLLGFALVYGLLALAALVAIRRAKEARS
ncbi:MAG: hypothetical protein AMXMBFR33_14130 [Candidatus Xenobia bacterium]